MQDHAGHYLAKKKLLPQTCFLTRVADEGKSGGVCVASLKPGRERGSGTLLPLLSSVILWNN